MSFLFDPIESGIDNLLDPLTSEFGVLAPTVATSVQPPEPMGNAQSTAVDDEATATVTAISVITPSATVESSSTTTTQRSTSSQAESTTSRAIRSSSSTSETSTSSSSSSSSPPLTLTRTTFSTSTTSRTSSSTSSLLVTSTSSTPAAPSAAPPLTPAQSNSHEPSSKPDSKISTAGIVVAIVFAVALLISIIWLTIRFCPPVRRRIDAWSTARRNNRTYREALDGPPPPEKDYAYSLSSNSSQQRKSVSAQAAEKIGVGKRPFSFFGIGGNPSIEQQQKSGYFWQVESASGPVHQQYFSPNSAETPKGNGLGLGRVSLLRNHSLLRKAGHDVPPVPGPSMTQTQAEIVGMGHISRQIALPLQPQVARKPLPARLPIPVKAASPRSRPFSYEAEHARIPRPVRSTESIQSARLKHKNSPLPKLQLEIPPTPLERRSQIGLAVTSSTPPVHVR